MCLSSSFCKLVFVTTLNNIYYLQAYPCTSFCPYTILDLLFLCTVNLRILGTGMESHILNFEAYFQSTILQFINHFISLLLLIFSADSIFLHSFQSRYSDIFSTKPNSWKRRCQVWNSCLK